MYHGHWAQLTNTLGRLLGQNVTFEGLFSLETVSGFFEALVSATISLDLRHDMSPHCDSQNALTD